MFWDYHPVGDPRPPRELRPAPDLERHRALQPQPRPHRHQRVSRDELPRGHADDGPGNARRVDLGLRRRLRPPLRRLGRDEPQRHRPRLRDLRQRHRRDRRTGSRALRNHEDLVPAVARQQPARVVDARQRQLHPDRSARHPRLRRRERLRDAAQFLPHRPQVVAARRRRRPLRLCHPRGPARPAARRADGQPAAAAGHRGRPFAPGLHRPKRATFPAGTFVVRLDQPYRNYAVDLLSPQDFQFAPGELPYDDVSWALPVHFGVETIRSTTRGCSRWRSIR